MNFLENKYTSTYFKIIENAKLRGSLTEYTELHHIVPRCLGGTNDKTNLVRLTAREHFICHWLLTKMVEGPAYYKLEMALTCFTRLGKTHERIYSGAQYARAKHARKQKRPDISARFTGKGNPMWGKKPSADTVEKIRGSQPNSTVIICNQTGVSYRSQMDAARSLGLKQGDIANVLAGRQKTTKGYSFSYDSQ